MTNPTHFADELLNELRGVVAANPAPKASTHRAPVRRNRLAFSGVGIAALGATAAILILGSGSATPSAYAVAAASDGSVTVHVRSLSDAAGLQRSLRAAGVRAIVNYAPDGKLPSCPPPSGPVLSTQSGSVAKRGSSGPGVSTAGAAPPVAIPAPPPGASVMRSSIEVSKEGVTFTISSGMIKPDEQLVITTSEGTLSSVGVAIAKISAGACSATAPGTP
ncbi:MAG: hypothetical protein ACYDHN_11380 [Solirubrobacteraceae bacterium]